MITAFESEKLTVSYAALDRKDRGVHDSLTDDLKPPPTLAQVESMRDRMMESVLWTEIRKMAETDEGMKDLLSQVKTYYYLRKGK
jgi:hypothetical protein